MSEDFYRFIINATITLKEKKKAKKKKKRSGVDFQSIST